MMASLQTTLHTPNTKQIDTTVPTEQVKIDSPKKTHPRAPNKQNINEKHWKQHKPKKKTPYL